MTESSYSSSRSSTSAIVCTFLMVIIENNGAIIGNNRSIFGEILNRIKGRKRRIIGTVLSGTQAMDVHVPYIHVYVDCEHAHVLNTQTYH